MPIKHTVKQIQDMAEAAVDDILEKELTDLFGANAEKRREAIESKTRTAVDVYDEFLKGISDDDTWTNKFPLFVKEIEKSASYSKGTVSTSDLRDAYNRCKNLFDKVSGLEQSHRDVSVIATQLFLLYTICNRHSQNKDNWYNPKTGNVGVKYIAHEKLTKALGKTANDASVRQMSQAEAIKMTERIRQIYITAKALVEMPMSEFTGNDDKDILKALDRYFEGTDEQTHLIKKKKVIDVFTGKVNQELVLESQEAQTEDGKGIEYWLGKARASALKKQEDQKLKNALAKHAENFEKIKGSKLIGNEITRQLAAAATGKPVKPYKSNTTKKKTQKVKRKPSKNVNRLKRKARLVSKLPPLPAKVMAESGGRDRMVEALQLKKLINKRLPAEVRRNMGRPALVNRTGRFSDSVELTDVRVSPKGGFSGDYTYRLSPYETFENQGVRRWPTGYNPKNLITKSIRNLAIQYTTQQFTYLRRT